MKEYMKIIKILEEEYKGLGCALNFTSPFELLVATILSAQTTDEIVNKATKELFKKYNTPYEIANISLEELEKYIKICGLYKTKAKNIINASKIIVEKFNGEVPDKMEDLLTLPGVGRKTANVVLSNAFGKDAIAVDTHVFRVANRIGLANSKDVVQTEKQLMKNIPKNYWSSLHHWLIWHGRKICTARKPKCDICKIKEYCKFYKDNML
ncbi:DNA-(apurinic or apyrimidinic site) lyase /endonuclease III [Caloramator fervidus]|uniref:Endonuclease III n=1 Tax=Caloramator fervidus TaxID=29344 RepID=A0A1H5SJG7_9CLOT|nr:endonuclease III [Caloramator fervidus]SEF50746.1 DNA-(apurinic or apyrimidinic site) lyase /endonuclease III [Caloramator fervidus]